MSGPRECGVCWYVYDPAQGDAVGQVPPGTEFEALPPEWRCPRCDSESSRFLLTTSWEACDPRVSALVAAYERIRHRMESLPVFNVALRVEATGFREVRAGYLGALVTPWSINAVLFPADADSAPPQGVERALPVGPVLFLPQTLEGLGYVELCSLFSPALGFECQDAAVETAREAIELLCTAPVVEAHSRRAVLSLFRRRA